MKAALIYVDGAFWRENGRNGGIGVSVRGTDGREVFCYAEPVRCSSPNEAEYLAIDAAVRIALCLRVRTVTIFCDSQHVVDAIHYTRNEGNGRCRKLRDRIARRLASEFLHGRVSYIHRDLNACADFLAAQGSRGRWFQTAGTTAGYETAAA